MAVTGFARAPTVAHVPHYIKARSPDGLIRAMLENNVRLKAYVDYFDIQFVNGQWFAWYLIDIEKTFGGK